MNTSLEEICWSVQLNHEFKEKLQPFVMPRLKQAIAFLPLSLRLFSIIYIFYYIYFLFYKNNKFYLKKTKLSYYDFLGT
jgi:hypothetical protein